MRKQKKFGMIVNMIVSSLFISLLILPQPTVAAEVIVPIGFTVEVYAENVPMPLGLSFDSQGNLYVAHDEIRPGRIYKISPGGVSISLFGPTINDPDSVAVDSVDYIFVGSEQGLYRVAPDGTSKLFTSVYMGNNTALAIDHAGVFGEIGTIFVGNARSEYDIVKVKSDGSAYEFVSDSVLYIPFGLAFDDIGYLYAAERSKEVEDVRGVYRITANGEVSYFVGLTTPYSITFDKIQRELYVGDVADKRIYKISLDGDVSVFAENISPVGLTFGPDDSLYVSDRSISPHRILKISGFASSIPIIFPDDTMAPTGAVHAHDNMLWPLNNKMVTVTLDGYVVDELSIARDGGGIGVSSAYLLVDGNEIVLKDETTDLLGEDGSFSVEVEVKAIKDAVYNVELYATDTEPEEGWETDGPNSGLVDSTYIRIPHDKERTDRGQGLTGCPRIQISKIYFQ